MIGGKAVARFDESEVSSSFLSQQYYTRPQSTL